MLCNGPVEWTSSKLPRDTPGQSSHHNEYMSCSSASKTCQWLRYLLEEMGLQAWCNKSTYLYGDNDAATMFARDDFITKANRYYRKDAHFAKTSYKLNITNPVQVRSEDNLADGFTKSLKPPLFNKLFPMVTGMVPISEESKPKGSLDRMQRKPTEPDRKDALDHQLPDETRKLLKEETERLLSKRNKGDS